MAEPGDPDAPQTPDPAVDHDDLIGFSSAAALRGRPRVPPEPKPAPAPPHEPEPIPPTIFEPEPDLFEPIAPPTATTPAPAPLSEPTPAPAPSLTPIHAPPAPSTPSWAVESAPPAGSIRMDGRTVVPPKEVANSTGLYAVYALILFAVPTLGVSAVIALLAVTGRPGPTGTAAASHFVFQQRTLWVGAVVALLGAILIAVGLGVFVLFIVAVWLILRGASGVLALKAGRAVRDPRGWFLA